MVTETLGLTMLPVGAGAGLASPKRFCVSGSLIINDLKGSLSVTRELNGGRLASNQKVFAEVHGGFRV